MAESNNAATTESERAGRADNADNDDKPPMAECKKASKAQKAAWIERLTDLEQIWGGKRAAEAIDHKIEYNSWTLQHAIRYEIGLRNSLIGEYYPLELAKLEAEAEAIAGPPLFTPAGVEIRKRSAEAIEDDLRRVALAWHNHVRSAGLAVPADTHGLLEGVRVEYAMVFNTDHAFSLDEQAKIALDDVVDEAQARTQRCQARCGHELLFNLVGAHHMADWVERLRLINLLRSDAGLDWSKHDLGPQCVVS